MEESRLECPTIDADEFMRLTTEVQKAELNPNTSHELSRVNHTVHEKTIMCSEVTNALEGAWSRPGHHSTIKLQALETIIALLPHAPVEQETSKTNPTGKKK